jgi:citrate lyase subunit beta / citryl-CoA lyase
MATVVHRSMLILPSHVHRFVEKAYLRGADAIVLDLEDAVPPSEKEAARTFVKDAIALAGRGGADVLVRVNNEPDLVRLDLEAAVHPGLHAIFMPKVESPEDLARLEFRVSELEAARGIEPGAIRISAHIESPRGLLNIGQILAASRRVESMSIGVDDYCLQLGVEPSEDSIELLFPFCMLVTACKAEGIAPLGVLGTVAGFRDLEGFRRSAENGRQLGCAGAFCIHPDQVAILNEVFSPTPAKVDNARRIVDAFEEGLKTGRAAVSLNGRMVDTPVYKQAKSVMERAEAIEAVERRKAEALARAGGA